MSHGETIDMFLVWNEFENFALRRGPCPGVFCTQPAISVWRVRHQQRSLLRLRYSLSLLRSVRRLTPIILAAWVRLSLQRSSAAKMSCFSTPQRVGIGAGERGS